MTWAKWRYSTHGTTIVITLLLLLHLGQDNPHGYTSLRCTTHDWHLCLLKWHSPKHIYHVSTWNTIIIPIVIFSMLYLSHCDFVNAYIKDCALHSFSQLWLFVRDIYSVNKSFPYWMMIFTTDSWINTINTIALDSINWRPHCLTLKKSTKRWFQPSFK